MQTCDILIVGGGVMGLSLAHALVSRRAGRVVVLEKAFLGAGSSGNPRASRRAFSSTVLSRRTRRPARPPHPRACIWRPCVIPLTSTPRTEP